MKKLRKSLCLIFSILILAGIVLPSAASADTGTYSRYGIIKGSRGGQIGIHSINGKAAYCIDPDLNWPEEGTQMTPAGSPSVIQGSSTTADLVMAAIEAYNDLGTIDSQARTLCSIIIRYICKGYLAWNPSAQSVYATVTEDPEGFAEYYNGIATWEEFLDQITMDGSLINSAMQYRINNPTGRITFSKNTMNLQWYDSIGAYYGEIQDMSGVLATLADKGKSYDVKYALDDLSVDDGNGAYIIIGKTGSNYTATVSQSAVDRYFTKNGSTYTFTTSDLTRECASQDHGYIPADNFEVYQASGNVQQLVMLKENVFKRKAYFPAVTLSISEDVPDPAEGKGNLRIKKESDDGNVSGVSFTVTGYENVPVTPVSLTGLISGWTITAKDAGDSCDWIGVAQSGNYTLIVRTDAYSRDVHWGNAHKYTGSNVQTMLNSWYAGAFPQKLKAAAAKSNAGTNGLTDTSEVSTPSGPAGSETKDIVFAPSHGEYSRYMAVYYKTAIFQADWYEHTGQERAAIISNSKKLYNYYTTYRWAYGRTTTYNPNFEIYEDTCFNFDVYDMQTHYVYFGSDINWPYNTSDVLPAMWVCSDRIKWTTDDGQSSSAVPVSYTVTTRYDGTALLEGLSPGQFTVSENGDWEKYEKINPKTVAVSADSTAEVLFKNTVIRKDGSITVRKSSEDGIIYNMPFILTDRNDPSKTWRAVTGNDGTAVFEHIPYGSYICEEEGSARYKKLQCEITLNSASSDIVWNARNSIVKGRALVMKLSAVQGAVPDGDASFEGITFDISAASDNVFVYFDKGTRSYKKGEKVLSITTGTDGRAETDHAILGAGRYIMKETDTGSSGYTVNEDWSYEFEVSSSVYDSLDGDGNPVYSATASDMPVSGGISVQKTDNLTGMAKPLPGASFEGAVFEIVNRSENPVTVDSVRYAPGTVVNVLITDEGGYAQTGNVLPYGTYGIREVAAPKGYVIFPDEKTVEIRDGETVYEETISEKAVEAAVFRKTDAASGIGLEGAVIRVTDRTDDSIYEITTDEHGQAPFALVPGHRYIYQEIKAPEEYIADTSIYSFEVDLNGYADTDFRIKNRTKGTVEITKTDALTGDVLEGAVISVFSEGGNELFSAATDRFGRIYFDASEHLKDNRTAAFTYKETSAPKGYYLDTDSHSFTVSPDGTVTGSMTLQDVPVGTVAIKKTDDNGVTLPGARISIYTASGTLAGQAATGSTGRIYFRPESPGTYYFVEDQAPSGYVRNGEKHTFTIDGNGNISGTVVMKNTRQASGSTGDMSFGKAAAVISVMSAAAAIALLAVRNREKIRKVVKHGKEENGK